MSVSCLHRPSPFFHGRPTKSHAEHQSRAPERSHGGIECHYDAHLEVGQHGFALFLTPDAEASVLDVDGTSEQLDAVVHHLQAALAARRTPDASAEGDPVRTSTRRRRQEDGMDQRVCLKGLSTIEDSVTRGQAR
jgi:hypothetical protein